MVENIRKKFQKNGISAEKIINEGRSKTREETLKKYNQIDIALDPFPYSGITTSFESVWMGVPLYVLNGYNFYSRTGISIYNKPIWVTEWNLQMSKITGNTFTDINFKRHTSL